MSDSKHVTSWTIGATIVWGNKDSLKVDKKSCQIVTTQILLNVLELPANVFLCYSVWFGKLV